MSPSGRALGLAVLVVVAGCSLPVGDRPAPTESPTRTPEDTPTPTPAPPTTPTLTPTTTPAPTPTPGDPSSYPPGVSRVGIVNASELVSGHVEALNRTGYVAVGQGDTTILRSGFLVGVTTRARTVVRPGSARYYEVRHIDAGLVNRVAERYSNGTVERLRRTENGEVTRKQRQPRDPAVLASAGLLQSLLEGGDFNVTGVREVDETVVFTARANRTDNVTALHTSLPEGAQEVNSYRATVEVDGVGRVRSLNATIEFVIADRNRTHRVGYRLQELGVNSVPTPDWVNETAGEGGAAAGRHWSRFVVSTSGCRA